MVITPKNLLKHELIRLKIEVVQSTDSSVVGVIGQVIGESKNMLTIRTAPDKTVDVQKKGTVFVVHLGQEKVEVRGDLLLQKPDERTKTLVKKW